MLDYLRHTGRNRISRKKLLGVLEADDILLYSLRIHHATVVPWAWAGAPSSRPIHNSRAQVGENPSLVRRPSDSVAPHGDSDKSKALFAEVFKLLGKRSYGKFIEAFERHTNVSYTEDEKTMDSALRSAWFEDLTEIGAAYEITLRQFTEPFRSAAVCANWPNSEFSSYTSTSLTASLTAETLSLYRWTPTPRASP